jgi:hypothetical protein
VNDDLQSDFGANESTGSERRPEQRRLHDSQNFTSEFRLHRLTHEFRGKDASVLTDLDIDVKDFDVHLSVVYLPFRGMDQRKSEATCWPTRFRRPWWAMSLDVSPALDAERVQAILLDSEF